MVRHRFNWTNKMEVLSFTRNFYVWKIDNFSYCASLCYLFLPTLLLTVTRKKFCDHFLKYEKECLYLWHLCIPWSYAQKNTNYSSPEKIVSQIIEKCKGHDLYYWNIDVGHSSLNVFYVFWFFWFFAYLRFNDIGKVDHLHFCNFFSYHDFSLFALFYYFITLFQTSIFVQKLHFLKWKKNVNPISF